MKIDFGPNDYIEMIGSGENGELTKQELDIFKFTLERRIELEETKLETPDAGDTEPTDKTSTDLVPPQEPVTESITEDITDDSLRDIDRCICDIDNDTEENSSNFDKGTLMKDFYESPFYGILKEVMKSNKMDKVKCKVSIKESCAYFPIFDFSTGVRVICIDTEILNQFKIHPLLLDRKVIFPFRIPKCGIKTRIIYSDICRECHMSTALALTKLIVEETKPFAKTPKSSNV